MTLSFSEKRAMSLGHLMFVEKVVDLFQNSHFLYIKR